MTPPPSRRRPIILAFIALLAAGTYGGFRWYEQRQPYEWSGTVEARTISVGSRTGGRVKEVLAREGDRVNAGAPLVVLEAGDLNAQKLAAEGAVEQARANLDRLEKGARPEEIEEAKARSQNAAAALQESIAGSRSEEIAAANARLVALQVQLDKAELDEHRVRRLFDSGSVSQAELDNSESALRGAVAQRDAQAKVLEELQHGARREQVAQAAARAKEALANEKLVVAGSRVEDIRAARGALLGAEGKLQQIGVMLDELTVKAPRPARIEALDLRPGDIVAPNATAATLLEDGELYVRIYVPETQIGRVRVGLIAPITVDSFPGRTFEGIVEHINVVGEYSPRNLQTADERADQVFAARVGIKSGEDDLRAGMAAFLRVPK